MAAVKPLKLVDLGSGQGALKEFETGDQLATALNGAAIVTLASSATPAIGAAAANTITVTGTTGITGFDTAPSGAKRSLIFTGIVTLTHNGTSLILPKAANITTAAGDVLQFVSLGGGNWKCTGKMLAAEGASWGNITGTLSAQTDLQAVLTSLGNRITALEALQALPWRDLTASRAANTAYTNSGTTGFFVSVTATNTGSAGAFGPTITVVQGANTTVHINGPAQTTGAGNMTACILVWIPAGATYTLTLANANLYKFNETRP